MGGAGLGSINITFTGPDGVGDHRTTVVEQRYVGYGSMSPEASSDTQYLYRSAPVSRQPVYSVLAAVLVY